MIPSSDPTPVVPMPKIEVTDILKAVGAILVSAQTVSNAIRDLCGGETAPK